jgi:hypothetical protein
MLDGLYKVEAQSPRGSGRGVIVARAGRIYGGNAAFAFAGNCRRSGEGFTVEISTLLRNGNPDFKPISGADNITLQGCRAGEQYLFEGTSPLLRGAFKTVITGISEDAAPPARASGADGIGNGLYSLNIRMLDGIDGGNTGIMVLHDGSIRGGDAFFDYVGAYSSAQGRWKGEMINHEHTPSRGERPVFGGREVGIGFSGTYNAEGAEGEATALAGKRSIRFKAVLRKLVAA